MAARRKDAWRERFRIASVAAAATAIVLLAASLPWSDKAPGVAAASEISDAVRQAARSLHAYQASFSIHEQGWHRLVPERDFEARVWFRAPERFRLLISDSTAYPSPRWPRNNIELIASSQRWWIKEPSSCPHAALPGCPPSTVEQRALVNRQPFDGGTALPTDLILPLETLASSGAFSVVDRMKVLNRAAIGVELAYRDAVPLVRALQQGGSWNRFAPDDRVRVWLDEETWFPLRFFITGRDGASLEVRATSFSETPEVSPNTFFAPAQGLVRDGGFREQELRAADAPAPSFTAGLSRYREGRAAHGIALRTYARGMTWLKVSADRGRATRSAAGHLLTAEELRLPNGGWAYYQPATESLKRRIDLQAPGMHVQVESNLTRDELIDVAASLDVLGSRLPRVTRLGDTTVRRLRPTGVPALAPFFKAPTFVPDGYRASAALYSTSRGRRSVTVFYRRPQSDYEGQDIRITQSSPLAFLSPTSENPLAVRIGDINGRWFAERGVLEWLDGRVYRSITAPGFELRSIAAIAAGLR